MPWTKADVEQHKKGLNDTQKGQWVSIANSVLKKCLADGGKEAECAASAIRQADGVVGHGENLSVHHIQSNPYVIRTGMHQGRKHIIVPVIMMVEGVHNGSHGPLLHLAEDLCKFPEAWNGIPISVSHPEMEGRIVSANRPNIIDQQGVGRVYGTEFIDGKLKGEAWIDEEKLRQISQTAYAYIMQARPLDVSVGVFTEDEPVSGVWNGEQYVGVARNYRPDHLALLPGGQGACSWQDGCGIRANAEGGVKVNEIIKSIKEYVGKGYYSLIQINGVGFRDIISAIQSKLDQMNNGTNVHFLKDVFDGYFIYEVESKIAPSGRVLYKRGYTKNIEGGVEFSEDPVLVVKKVEYIAKTNNNIEGGGKIMNKCCPKKIEALLQSRNTSFVEADKTWLETLEEVYIDKLIAMQKEPEPQKEKEEKTPQQLKEEAINVLKEQLNDSKKFLELLPEETRKQMEYGMKLYQEARQELIDHITSNADVFTKEELQSKETEELKKIAALIKPQVDYSGGGAGSVTVQSENDLLLPVGVVIEGKK